MKTLNDVRVYARTKGMSETDIERLISEVETDGNGNVLGYDRVCFGIDCEMDGREVISKHDFGCDPIIFKAKYIANTTKELDGKFFKGTEMRIKRITHFVKKYATTREVFNTMTEVALLYESDEEQLIGVEIVNEVKKGMVITEEKANELLLKI